MAETRYYSTEIHTVNGIEAYDFSILPSEGLYQSRTRVTGESQPFYVGVRMYHVNLLGDLRELTEGTPVGIARFGYETGEFLYWAYMNLPQVVLFKKNEALKIDVYLRFENGTWNKLVDFITENLPESEFSALINTCFYWLRRTYDSGYTTGYFIWGHNYDSRIEGIHWEIHGLMITLIPNV